MLRSIPPLNVALMISGCLFPMSMALHGGQYGETFSSYAVGASSFSPATGELFSNQAGTTAAVRNATVKELRLTEFNVPSTNSAFRLPDLDAGTLVTAFSAKWNSQIKGDVFEGIADGLSMNFGPLGGSSAKFTDGSFLAESGYGAGLTVGVATYFEGSPGYSVRVNGETVPGGFVGKSDFDWGDFSEERHFFEVDWNYSSGLTLRVDGVAIFTNLPTVGYVPAVGNRFVFGARTGGVTSEMSVDNIVIVTGGTLAPVSLAAPYHYSNENPPDETADKAFDGSAETKWLGFMFPPPHIGASVAVPRTLRAYAVTSANDFEGRDPSDWTFETSGNNGGSWSSRGSQTGEAFFNRYEQRAFLVTTPAADMAMRLKISSNRGGDEVQLAELRAWDLVPGPPVLTVTNATDSAAGSLRAALATAAGAAGPACIVFAPGLAGSTISVASELVINDSAGVTIDAGGLAGGIILNGGNARRIMSNSGTGPVSISGITFSAGNGIPGYGGAFLGNTGSNTIFSRCSFMGNRADFGGAVYGFGTLALTDCTFSGNNAVSSGGALNPRGGAVLTRCTLQGNSATFGGAIENNGQLSLVHCTISGNTADVAGGGVDNYNGNVTLANTIIAGNTVNSQPGDFVHENGNAPSVTLTRVGANIVLAFASAGTNPIVTGPVPSTADPLLAPLADYGGPTRTMALKPGSPARDASVSSSAKVDQRGVAVSGVPDLGAYEAFVSTATNYEAWIVERLPAAASPASYAATVDYDGDSWTNKNEWEAYTDPADSNSYFKVTTTGLQGSTFIIQYTSVLGRNYYVQSSENLVNWTSYPPYPGTGTTGAVGLGPLTGIKALFMRVHPGF